VNSAKFIDLVAVDFLNLLSCQKNGILFQYIRPGGRWRALLSQAAKQPGVLGAGLAMSFIELLL
jgi:hypothetical protein